MCRVPGIEWVLMEIGILRSVAAAYKTQNQFKKLSRDTPNFKKIFSGKKLLKLIA